MRWQGSGLRAQRWPNGPSCPYYGSLNVQAGIKHRSMTHRCRDCPKRPMFSLKTGTVMHRTQLGYREWAIAIYLLPTNLKGVSSMKLHRDLVHRLSSGTPPTRQFQAVTACGAATGRFAERYLVLHEPALCP